MKKRLDSEEALVCIDAATKQAINLFDRKGDYSVSYLRCIIQIAKENLEKEFNYPVSEYSDWYIVKCKMTDEEAKRYVEKSLFILSEYRKHARQTIGFPGSQRHKTVSEYIKHIPIFKPFEPDTSKGDYINKVNEKKVLFRNSKRIR